MENLINKHFHYAIVGVSEDKEKWGRKLYDNMKQLGYKVTPVNPKYIEISGDRCYGLLKDISEPIDVLVTVVPPHVTERYVQEAINLEINKVWMQPGSESDTAIKLCKDNNIEPIVACFIVDGLKTHWL